MRRHPVLAPGIAIAAAFALAASVLATPSTVHACSAGPDFDPLEGLDIIVTGYATDVTLTGKDGQAYFLTVDVAFEVDRYLIGDGPATLVLTDPRSAVPYGLFHNREDFDALDLTTIPIDELSWDGSGGSCGALDSDPRGQYWVVGASQMEGGTLAIHRFSMFAIGTGPDDPRILERVRFIEGRTAHPAVLPASSGNAGLVQTPPLPLPGAPLAGVLLGVVLLGARRRTGVRR